jgi:ligand-binding sensor domain-containing protein
VTKVRYYYIISAILFINQILVGQELLFEKPINLTNLPSNECYNIIQDKKGYIWFSTDAGLCKYDGNKVKVFSKKEGFPEESCYGITMDSKGVIYIISSSNRVLKIKNDSLHELAFTKPFQKEMGNSINFATDFKIINDSFLIVNTQVKTYKINVTTNRFKKIDAEKFKHVFNIKGNTVYSIKSFVDTKDYRNKKENYTSLIINYDDKTFETQFDDTLNIKRTRYRIKSCVYKETLFIGYGSVLIKVQKSGKTESLNLKDDILCMELNKEGTLFVGVQNIGLLAFTNTEILEENKLQQLKNFSVTGIQLDARGGIWCSTLENGIMYCENPFINKISSFEYKNIKSNLFKKIDSSLWFSDIKGDVWKTDGETFSYYHLPIVNKQLTNEVLKFDKSVFLATDQGLFKYNEDFNKGERIHLSNLHSVYTAKNLIQFDSKIFGVKNTSLFEIKNNIIIERIISFNSKASSIVTNNKQLFIVKEEGLFSVDTNNYSLSLYYPLKLIKKIEFPANSSDKNLFLALTKDGFFVIDNFKKYNFDFNNKENIRVNDFFLDKNRVWLATNIGVIEIPSFKENKYIIYNSFFG